MIHLHIYVSLLIFFRQNALHTVQAVLSSISGKQELLVVRSRKKHVSSTGLSVQFFSTLRKCFHLCSELKEPISLLF